MDLFECHRLRAKISERQCGINRNGYRSRGLIAAPITSCQGCAGLGEPAQVSLPVQEKSVKKKKIECGRSGCGYGVKKQGDFCKKHQEPVVIPVEDQKRGLDDGPKLPRQSAFYTVPDERPISEVIIDLPMGITYEDENEKASHAPGCDIFEAGGCTCQPAQDGPPTPMPAVLPDLTAEEIMEAIDHFNVAIDAWVPDNSFEDILVNSQVERAPKLTGLAALLRTPPQPVEPEGLVIPFSREEVIALTEAEVTTEDIRDLACMLLRGELARVAVA